MIGVGTTAVRAAESAVDETGAPVAGEGWTNLHLTAASELRVVTGLLTGFHEPDASHLDLLSAFVPEASLEAYYATAIEQGYDWHEFGDVHLLLRHGAAAP